jgi:hypothetical protein
MCIFLFQLNTKLSEKPIITQKNVTKLRLSTEKNSEVKNKDCCENFETFQQNAEIIISKEAWYRFILGKVKEQKSQKKEQDIRPRYRG